MIEDRANQDTLNQEGGRMDWKKAEAHVRYMRRCYKEIGAAGRPVLVTALIPLLSRFDAGERSQELYDEMMSVE